MLDKKFSVVSVFFILMLATFAFAGDQLNAPGVNTTNLVYQGYIVRMDWYSSTGVQLKMTVKSLLPSPSSKATMVFIVNAQTLININGRLAGPKELAIGDVVTVNYDQSNVASKVSVKRPGTKNIVRMACKIEEIRFSGPSYVFVMESVPSPGYYYELIVTPNSRLIRNGKPADPSEFQIDDVGTAQYYVDNLKIVSFVAINK